MSDDLTRATDAAAHAWFDRIQAQRLDEGRKRPDGGRWQWDDLTEHDRVAYRALVRPVVEAALGALRCGPDCDCRQCRVNRMFADDGGAS